MNKVLIDSKEASTIVSNPEKNSLTTWINNPYIKAATSENTRIAYRSDIRHFEKWGGKLPATPDRIAEYLQAYATQLNSRTLSRRLTALKHWHNYQGFPDPTSHPAIQKTMTGIMRVHGKPKEKAPPLMLEDLLKLVKYLEAEGSFVSFRDNALLQVGFFGAFRRSELVQLKIEHITEKEQGIEIMIPGSKTDPLHEGQFCALPFGKNGLCPITALKKWLEVANIHHGAIFREIKRGDKLKEKCLSPLSVNYILKKRGDACGLLDAAKLSGHSLRRGLATCATQAGANLSAIMRQGRWKQVNTVMEYIEANDRFSDNAALSVMEKFRQN